ncbi:Flp family type IVb pilin [Rhizobium arsenicireducens]|jgi:pilus assembly protein Flp/PilA
MHLVLKFIADRQAATAIEYGLIAAIIGLALILGLGAFSDSLAAMFETISTTINDSWK